MASLFPTDSIQGLLSGLFHPSAHLQSLKCNTRSSGNPTSLRNCQNPGSRLISSPSRLSYPACGTSFPTQSDHTLHSRLEVGSVTPYFPLSDVLYSSQSIDTTEEASWPRIILAGLPLFSLFYWRLHVNTMPHLSQNERLRAIGMLETGMPKNVMVRHFWCSSEHHTVTLETLSTSWQHQRLSTFWVITVMSHW